MPQLVIDEYSVDFHFDLSCCTSELCYLATDAGHGAYLGLHKHGDVPFLLKGCAAHHQGGLFLLVEGIHQVNLLLAGNHLIQGEDIDHPLLYGVECILHIATGRLLCVVVDRLL